jgi:cytoskeleton protein RodZ
MEDIGKRLREARERLGLTLDEAERATRIRSHHLEALERGDLDALPSSVQARGFLRNYADFLGLDVEGIMLAYADALQTHSKRARPEPAPGQAGRRGATPRRWRLGRWLSADFFISAAIVLIVLVVLIWGGSRLMSVMRQQTEAVEQGGGFDTPTASATFTPPPSATATLIFGSNVSISPADSATPTFAPLGLPVAGVNLRLLGEKRAWVQVSVDGRLRFSGMVLPGDILEYNANTSVELTTGDAGGVRAFFNGQDQGVLGDIGQVVIRLWTIEGMITPTPTETATATPTLPPTRTPIPTRTLIPTRTSLAP